MSKISELMVENRQLEKRNKELGEILQSAVDVVTNVELLGVFAFYEAHGQRYKGPVFDVEKARTALEKP